MASCPAGSTCKDLAPPAFGDATGRTCTCATGTFFNNSKCEEIDACKAFACAASEVCVDIAGGANSTAGRTCECQTGYARNSQFACVDVNACLNNPCLDADVQCSDLPPPALDNPAGRVCNCPNGAYIAPSDPHHCTDIDACVSYPCIGPSVCNDIQRGPNSTAGRTCACDNGYKLVGASNCVEYDACADFPCDANARCSDVFAGPLTAAGRLCTCNTGYTGSGETCSDLNACTGVTCGTNEECVDQPPPADVTGYLCRCKPSYTRNAANQCFFVNYCANSPCQAQSTCVPIESGRVCTCNQGFEELTAGVCTEINGCANNPCAVNSTCADIVGGGRNDRTCTCKPGYAGPNGNTCQEIDACALNPCGSATESCQDLPPPALGDPSGRVCACKPGYTINPNDSSQCVDINACVTTPCATQATCRDLKAPAGAGEDGRTCVCNKGYRGNGEVCIEETNNADGNTGSSSGGSGGTAKTDLVPIIVMAGVVFLVAVVMIFFVVRTLSKRTAAVPITATQATRGRETFAMTNPLYEAQRREEFDQAAFAGPPTYESGDYLNINVPAHE